MTHIPASQPSPMYTDAERVTAAADLVGRTGARHLEVGYLHDDVPAAEAGWYAHAAYAGARITVEDQPGPAEALEALARRLLTGGKCTTCGSLIAMSVAGAMFYPNAQMADGTTFTHDAATAGPLCQWRQVGPKWVAGCTIADNG